MQRRVEVVEQRGSVAELHALDPFVRGQPPAEVWWCRPSDAAVVLGSRQGPALLDADACRTAGMSVVRRRSGGGAVVVQPDAIVWIDLVIPPGILSDDVRASMVRVGDIWYRALHDEIVASAGRTAAPALRVHRGGMVASDWSDLVCFAGLGPGEITIGTAAGPEHKLVGLSQRRGRFGARVQGSLYRRPVTREILALLAGRARPATELVEPAVLPGVDAEGLAHGLARALQSELTPV